MRKRLAVLFTSAFLVVGGLASVSSPFDIGSIIIRNPIVLARHAASRVVRTLTGSAAASPARPASRPSAPMTDDSAKTRPQTGSQPEAWKAPRPGLRTAAAVKERKVREERVEAKVREAVTDTVEAKVRTEVKERVAVRTRAKEAKEKKQSIERPIRKPAHVWRPIRRR